MTIKEQLEALWRGPLINSLRANKFTIVGRLIRRVIVVNSKLA